MEGMDRIIEKKGIPRKYIWIGFVTVAFLVILLVLFSQSGVSTLRIEKQNVTIREVIFDKYQDYISVNGTIEPLTTVYLDAVESGRVEEILVEEGARLNKGDVILELSNYNLVLDISGNEADVSRAINDLKTTRINLENQMIQSKSRLLELEYSLIQLNRQFENNSRLYTDNLISREEFDLSKENLDQTVQQYELQKQKYLSDSLYIKTRLESDELSIERMQNNLELTRRRLDNLMIKAPVDGELALLNPEIGQVISYGTRLGIIHVLDSYKMQVLIDEHYITRISRGLAGSFNFAGSDHQLEITKVLPEIRNGTFAVEMEFTSTVPDQIRIGQTARIRLELGETEDAILLPRGSFFQSTGGRWIYVIDPSGGSAYKRDIELGRQNPNYYEVLSGLIEGEQVIVSGYENFGNADKLIFK